MEITGTIQQQGITSYQYGTHTITTTNDEFYALKSETVDLDDYVNRRSHYSGRKNRRISL